MVAGSRAAVLVLLLLSQIFLAADANSTASECVSDTNSLMQRARNPIPTFSSFIAKYRRQYSVGSQEYEKRRELFQQRLRHVQDHNSRLHRRWTAGINHLTDRTEAELKQLRGWRGVRPASGSHFVSAHSHVPSFFEQRKRPKLVEEKGWSHLKAVRATVVQGHCGGCWVFPASITLNAGAEIHGINRTFAAQDFLCNVPNPHKCGGTGGCQGGTVELAYHYTMECDTATEEEMPYEGSDDKCKKLDPPCLHSSFEENIENIIAIGTHWPTAANSPGPRLGFIGWERLPENKYEPLLRAVSEHGPVAVSVSANGWHPYDSGIFDNCTKDAIMNHAVTLVGYGKEGHDKFWHIKNSWGPTWGENSFMRLLRNDGEETEHCGIDKQPQEGSSCEGGPSEVKVCGMCGILYDNVVPFFQARPSQ